MLFEKVRLLHICRKFGILGFLWLVIVQHCSAQVIGELEEFSENYRGQLAKKAAGLLEPPTSELLLGLDFLGPNRDKVDFTYLSVGPIRPTTADHFCVEMMTQDYAYYATALFKIAKGVPKEGIETVKLGESQHAQEIAEYKSEELLSKGFYSTSRCGLEDTGKVVPSGLSNKPGVLRVTLNLASSPEPPSAYLIRKNGCSGASCTTNFQSCYRMPSTSYACELKLGKLSKTAEIYELKIAFYSPNGNPLEKSFEVFMPGKN